ncbi:Uncharacterised protein [Slackia heliotrinireducens]|uniref:Uncharacterized protein n=1 Tax=Slackia heliotrinireducens (strain ATCC 29202 / DSM 20476 / NCTC 11029 / RHS 1) TaxID=471855 RepID=C7N3T8_SLAHD|nr:hypothetical protein [Slackia heliotrinireducens]ACV21679.1 hypothetical protein Shel_06200 [Slackia heliotrinireducens DSM 20476]VEG99299.1 Uncharacterised protein [Slackia heliotrinireducens]
MAISRREILKLGVSYGTGAINFGNDSVAYDRELRKFTNNEAYAAFKAALVPQGEGDEATVDMAAAAEAGRAFQSLCGNLAISGLYMKMSDILAQLDEECLPAVAELDDLEADYQALVSYLKSA